MPYLYSFEIHTDKGPVQYETSAKHDIDGWKTLLKEITRLQRPGDGCNRTVNSVQLKQVKQIATP